jgi:curved DNA-binding protein CbpA
MTANADPWKTLGLAPGAGTEEIRRAYRRLAKVNHPDAAGESALPRFLAIQAAYEQLVAPSARRRPGTRPARSTSTPPEPWRADPDRASASGRADGRRPGARPTGRPGPAAGGTGSGSGPGASSGRAGTSTGGAGGAGGAAGGAGGAAGAAGASTGAAGSGSSSRSRRPSGRRRAPNKATPYSTSYDPGDEEPFEPGWSGASWYGSSSGTYWTINPKEYADPRKHGPEYQRRARRGATGWIVDDEPPAGPAGPEPNPPEPAAAPPPPEATWTDAAAGARPEHRGAPSDEGIDGEPVGAHAGAAASGIGDVPPPPSAHRPNPRDWFEEPPPDRRFRGPVLRRPTTGLGRLLMALLAWPPLALVTTVAIGEETGCGRFAASCGEASSPGTWIVLAAIFVLLLALPRIAGWLAHGTLATAVIGIPTAIVLSAGGGSRVPETSAAFLTTVLAIAWVAGVLYGLIVPRLGGSGAQSAARR